MDPVTLAASAVSLLVPYLAKAGRIVVENAGKDVGEFVSSKVEALYEAVKNKFTRNDYASQSLKRLAEKPDDEDRQATMKGVLKDALADDPRLQEMLSQLLAEIKQVGGDSIIQVYGSGAAATRGGVAAGERGYAAGGDINIGRVPSEHEE